MEKEISSAQSKSEISLRSKTHNEEDEDEELNTEIQKPKESQFDDPSSEWTSRLKCYEAYVCCIWCYSALQNDYMAMIDNGILVFIPFILFRIFIGIPGVIIQIMLARYIMSTNLTLMWSMHVLARGILYCEMVATAYYITHALVVVSYLTKYMFLSFTIPWNSCNSSWATTHCYESNHFEWFFAKCLERSTQEYCVSLEWRVSGLEYWIFVAASQNNTMSQFLTILYMFLITVIIFAMIIKGVQRAIKGFEFFAIVAIILGSFMAVIICLTAEFAVALKHLFIVDMSQLLSIQVWMIAYDATIFVLAIGRLPLALISSHKKNVNIFTDVLAVCITDILFLLLFVIPIYCVIKEINLNDNMSTEDWNSLNVFISLSEVVLYFPYPQHLFAILYYLLLVVITISSLAISMLALVHTIIGFAPDRFNYFYTSLFMCGSCFTVALVFLFCHLDFSTICDMFVTTILFLYLFTLIIFYGFQRFNDDFHFMMGYPVPFFLKLAWLISLPLSFIMIIVNGVLYTPDLSNTSHYLSLGIPFLLYTLVGCVYIGIEIYTSKKITALCFPNPDWGPADPICKNSKRNVL